jgi:hypothetical protein
MSIKTQISDTLTDIKVQSFGGAGDIICQGGDCLDFGGRLDGPEGIVFALIQIAALLTYLAVGLSVLMIVIGGIFFISDLGGGDRADKGKAIIKNALIGLLIAILAYTVISFLVNGLYSFMG